MVTNLVAQLEYNPSLLARFTKLEHLDSLVNLLRKLRLEWPIISNLLLNSHLYKVKSDLSPEEQILKLSNIVSNL